MRKLILYLFLSMSGGASFAQAVEPKPKETDSGSTPAAKNSNTNDSFWAQFGIGLSVSAKLGSEKSIDEAQLVNGIVRVTSERQVTPRLMLERHWYFKNDWKENPHF